MVNGSQTWGKQRRNLWKIFNFHLSISSMTNLNLMRMGSGKAKGMFNKIVREERTNCVF